MSKFDIVPINSFLKERDDRFKPDEANKLGLKRLEKIDFSGGIHIVDDKKTRTGMILVKKGDLVISGINVEKGAIAVHTGDEDVLATIHYSSYGFDKSKIDIEYFKWFLKSKTFRDIVKSSIKGGIKTELKPKKFLPLEIPLPDLDAQAEIRKSLDSVADEINQIRKVEIENEDYAQKLRQTILQEAISGKLVPQDPNDEPASELLKKIKAEKEKLIKEKKIRKEKPLPPISEEEIPYELPKWWEWVRLSLLVELKDGSIRRGPFGGSIKKEIFVKKSDNTFKVYEQKNAIYKNHKIGGYYINESNFQRLRSFETGPGDIIISCSGTIGETYLLPKDAPKGVINQALLKIKLNSTVITNEYFLYLFQSMIQEGVNKSSKGSAMKNIVSLNHIKKNVLFPLPPLNEQKRIVEKVNQLMKLCDELEQKVKENQKNSELLIEAVLREAFAV